MANNDSELRIIFDDDGDSSNNQEESPSSASRPAPNSGEPADSLTVDIGKELEALNTVFSEAGDNIERVAEALESAAAQAGQGIDPNLLPENPIGLLAEGIDKAVEDFVAQTAVIGGVVNDLKEVMLSFEEDVTAFERNTRELIAAISTMRSGNDDGDDTLLDLAGLLSGISPVQIDIDPIVDELKAVKDTIDDLQSIMGNYDPDPIVDELENLAAIFTAQSQKNKPNRGGTGGQRPFTPRTFKGAVGQLATKIAAEGATKAATAGATKAATKILGPIAGTLLGGPIGVAVGTAIGSIVGSAVGEMAANIAGAIQGMHAGIVAELREVNGVVAAAAAESDFRELQAAIDRGNRIGGEVAGAQGSFSDLSIAIKDAWAEFYLLLRPFLILLSEASTILIRLGIAVLVILNLIMKAIIIIIDALVFLISWIPLVGPWLSDIARALKGNPESDASFENQIDDLFNALNNTEEGAPKSGGFGRR